MASSPDARDLIDAPFNSVSSSPSISYSEINYDHEIVKHFKSKKKEKVFCDCGSMILKNGLKTHQKTKKHLDLMEKEEDFKYADEGMEYLTKNNQFVEENINEIIYDRLFKSGRS
jgi:hypothetical protein